LAFFAARFSLSVRPAGFLPTAFRGDLSDMGHLVWIVDHVRTSEIRARQPRSRRRPASPDRTLSVAHPQVGTPSQNGVIPLARAKGKC
jgi:hypothetical protein